MNECLVHIFNKVQMFLEHDCFQIKDTKFNFQIEKISYYLITQENLTKTETNQFKVPRDILVIDKYEEKLDNNIKYYLIFTFSQTVIIVDQKYLSQIEQILMNYDKSTIFFLSDSLNLFSDEIKKKFYNESIEMHFFVLEISRFRQRFNIQCDNNAISKFWDIVSRSIAGYLIQKGYSKKRDRFGRFLNDETKESIVKFDNDDFIYLRGIGNGSSGLAQLAYHIEKEEIFIIKDFYTSDGTKNQNREINNYESISYPLISQYFGTIDKNEKRSIVIEYINGTNLQDCFQLETNEKMKIIFEIMITIEYLHNNHFIYRDLRPNNVIIDYQKRAILIDFDKMIKIEDGTNNPNFTKDFCTNYFAPEFADGKASYASDIYSIGMLIYYILTIEMRHQKNSHFQQDLEKFSNIPDEFSQFRKICKKCTKEKPEERPLISELIDEFYYRFYSSNYSNKEFNEDVGIISNIKDIHSLKYFKYWLSLSEYEDKRLQLYKKSILSYKNTLYSSLKKSYEDNSQNNSFSFEHIPSSYQTKINQIQNKTIQKIYSNFDFLYYKDCDQNQNGLENNIFDFLKGFKFITCELTNLSGKYIDAIFCVEGKCLIIESIEINKIKTITKIVKENGSSIINVSCLNTNSDENSINNEIKEEINNFCKKFKSGINNNEFVRLTISSIACYIIRRYFYPTEYFNNHQFFYFECYINIIVTNKKYKITTMMIKKIIFVNSMRMNL